VYEDLRKRGFSKRKNFIFFWYFEVWIREEVGDLQNKIVNWYNSVCFFFYVSFALDILELEVREILMVYGNILQCMVVN
jgi:hypothetical protein